MTPGGLRLALKLGLGLDKPPVKVIPHQKTRRVGRLGLDISPHLRNGHILPLSLDLAACKTHLLAEVSFMILRYQRHVSNRREQLERQGRGLEFLQKWHQLIHRLQEEILATFMEFADPPEDDED